MTTSGDTQALPRIPVPGSVAAPLPTVALTLAVAAPETEPRTAREGTPAVRVAEENRAAALVPARAAESHVRIYEEAMATIAALASNWSSAVERTSGRHRAAA